MTEQNEKRLNYLIKYLVDQKWADIVDHLALKHPEDEKYVTHFHLLEAIDAAIEDEEKSNG